ncbi:MAG: TSUP family transporter [Candidatus Acidiferrales bacterium]
MKAALFIALGIFTAAYVAIWAISVIRARRKREAPDLRGGAIGLVTNFFDTLGIGSFATTTSFFKLGRLVRDEQIPGTLNVGHTLPSVLQAFIYIAVIRVDLMTLVLMIGASVLGSWLGAGIVARCPRRKIQIGMGLALLTTSGIMLMTQLNLLPGGGDLLGLSGLKLAAAVVANAVLGALMTLGIGLYAPCMVVVYLMGMNPKAAFPIMMGSCAFLMPVGSVRFIRAQSYNLKSALGLAIGGIPGVLLAAFLVRSLPLGAMRWLVIVVVVYTAMMLLRSAVIERNRQAAIPDAAS